MKEIFKLNLITAVLIILASSAFSQSIAQIEEELVAGISEIQKYSSYAGNHDDEKMPEAQDDFQAKLLKYTKNPATLQYKFPKLKDLMYTATSDDGKFRIYSWDLEDGGTMHNFARVYQYQAADGKVYSKAHEMTEEGGGGGFVTDIFTVETNGGPVYIVCSTFIASTQDHYQSANLYKIEGNSLVDKVKLIKTKSGLTDNLGFGYSFFSVVDRSERPVRLISYNKKTKTLKIPVVIEDQEFRNGRVTNRFISYRFNGTNFVKVS
jgi:hypothetical protein